MKSTDDKIVRETDLPENFKKILDTFPGFVWSGNSEGSIYYVNKKGLEFTGYSLEEVKKLNFLTSGFIHPDDRQRILKERDNIFASGKPGEFQTRLRRFDGEYFWFIHFLSPLFDGNNNITAWWGVNFNINERKKTEDELRRSKGHLAEAQKLSRTGSFSIDLATRELWVSEEIFSIIGYEKGSKPTLEESFERVHEDERQLVKEKFRNCMAEGKLFDQENRMVMPDGSIKFVHVVADKINLNSGSSEFVGAVSDITQMKLAEHEVRQKEKEFRQIVETVPCLIIIMKPTGEFLYANRNLLNYTGLKQEDVVSENFREKIFHPVELTYMRSKRDQVLRKAEIFETETRILGGDGKYRWFLTRFSPIKDENAQVVQWCMTSIDIDERKRNEEKIHNENIVLREEIDNTSNINIMGTSEQIQIVYRLISLVAATNSSVLILGETGTGKELVARAIHNASNRKHKVMIKVNCAALPANLIESELFGHEKGSFTGAIERRIGKFELAANSTLFLDEIGEMPLDLQSKLLRAIQEKEIERVGGKETLKVDVRIIAASNRNLENEVKSGNFRSDLYYRLNVFPIVVPPLRERKTDISILANYFLERSSKNIGKKITSISKEVMEELMNYNWPGNVRELEHLIERGVILNNDIIEEIHLPQIEPREDSGSEIGIIKTIQENERDHILKVLKKCKGKKSGAEGAAALLGIPVSTLNSKIKKLGIKNELIFSFKTKT